MLLNRTISEVERDIEKWIEVSSRGFDKFRDEKDPNKVWILKYFSPRFLEAFMKNRELAISATPGFTWGDGVYVAPLCYPYSTMMYGRVGVMGWIEANDLRNVYDASQLRGRELYQEWISGQSFLYRVLTTTIHADLANRQLRNRFRKRFGIDLVYFSPDQHNRAYVSSGDLWFCLSDWSSTGPQAPGQRPAMSSKVRGCAWVAIVGEEFEGSTFRTTYQNLIGPQLSPPPSTVHLADSGQNLETDLRKRHRNNNVHPPPPLQILLVRPLT